MPLRSPVEYMVDLVIVIVIFRRHLKAVVGSQDACYRFLSPTQCFFFVFEGGFELDCQGGSPALSLNQGKCLGHKNLG